jgi:hypothetical protein
MIKIWIRLVKNIIFFKALLIITKTQKFKSKERGIEMKKSSVFFLVAFVFVFFSFSFVIFAQDESEKPDNSKAEFQERANALDTEKEAISALRDEFSKRKADYETKCKGKTFDLNKGDEKQTANECQEESEWLISSQESLKERQQKYNTAFIQLQLDTDAFQALQMAELQGRANELNAESDAISALKDEYAKIKADYDAKCEGKTFGFLTEEEKQLVKYCQEARKLLISSQENLKERQQKYNEDLAQFRSDLNAAQKAPDTSKGQ